jgi:signal transduction histidine kinase/ligand-binding sensor domain-containing protein/AraC-like DNA-binding protein
MWIGSNKGLIKANLKNKSFRIYDLPQKELMSPLSLNIHSIIQDNQYLWLAVFRRGVIRFDRKTETFKDYGLQRDSENYVIKGIKDLNGKLWFASESLLYYDEENDCILKYTPDSSKPNVLDAMGFRDVYFDRKGAMWLGTNTSGVWYSFGPDSFNSFLIFKRGFSSEHWIGSVNSILIDGKKQYWIGHVQGIDIVDKDLTIVQRFGIEDGLSGDDIWDIKLDNKGNIWVTSYSKGLQRFDPAKGNFIDYPNIDSKTGLLTGQDIREIYYDRSKNQFWLAQHGNGLSMFDLSSGTFLNYKFDTDLDYLNWSTTIILDNEKNVWLGGFTGAFVFDHELKLKHHFVSSPENENSLSSININKIYQDSNGNIWVGTTSGLDLYRPQTRDFLRLGMLNKLLKADICDISEDKDGILWLSTKGVGILSFDPKKLSRENALDIQHYIRQDGLLSNEFSYRSFFRSSEGQFYYGGLNGFTSFVPGEIRNNQIVPNVEITRVSLFDELIYPSLNERVQYAKGLKKLVVRHYENVLTIGFNAFNFNKSEKNQYTYMLEGFDDRWYSANQHRKAVYTNLPAGRYTFRVKASNNDGVWNHEGASMEIVVLAAWWQTSIFRIAVLLFLILVSFFIFRWRVRSIKEQKYQLEKMVQAKTLELENQNLEIRQMADKLHEADQSKIRFFMNISHEFRTPLSLIIGPVEKVISRSDLLPDVQKQLNYVHRNARRLHRLISQLLDLRKMNLNLLKLKISEGNLNEFINQIYESFNFLAEDKSILYSFSVEGNQPDGSHWFDQDAVEKIISNLLSNAFRHTGRNGSVSILLKYHQDDMVSIIVRDTGSGISEVVMPYIFDRFYSSANGNASSEGIGIGLSLVRELVILHRGEIKVESKPGKGSEFNITIPIIRNAYSPEEIAEEALGRKCVETENAVNLIADIPQNVAKNGTTGSFRFLLVEDDQDLQRFIRDELSEMGEVKVAGNGEEAVRVLETYRPDIILSDIMMPVMNGMALCSLIKKSEEYSHIPVVLLTAQSNDENIISGLETGADDYITKPFNPSVLRARLLNIINTRRKLQKAFDRYATLMNDNQYISRKEDDFLERAIKYVENNISDPNLGLKELVKELGVSKTSLYNKINEQTGYSINIFIRIIRLKAAAYLLEAGHDNISEIAYSVGFNDPNYFSKCFKEYYKKTPSEFSKKMMK